MALVHGYAHKPELAKTVNVFYAQMLGLRASVYFDWVPSKANIADLPSRGAFAHTRAELAGIPIVGDAPDFRETHGYSLYPHTDTGYEQVQVYVS